MIANYACMDIRPGSMGRPLPGIEATVLVRDEHGKVIVGRRRRRPSRRPPARRASWRCGRGGRRCSVRYLGQDERYRACFAGGWYLSGDLARQDEDGYFWFVGRGDDVIKSAGHLIGPFEVESTLDGAPGGGRGRRDRQARPASLARW